MIKLFLSLQAAGALIRFEVPGPGTYYLFSVIDGSRTARIEACGHVDTPSHVIAPVKLIGAHKVFSVRFDPE